MPVFNSALSPVPPPTKEHLALIEKLEIASKKQTQGEGSERAKERARARGSLLASSRLSELLDPFAPFLELCGLAGLTQKEPSTVRGGIGVVSGVLVGVLVDVPTVRGGTVSPSSLAKRARICKIIDEARLPLVQLVESGGALLSKQFQVFHAGGGGFAELTQRSAAGLPTISLVFGNATAGGAYTPAMSDYMVLVKKKAHVFLAGPPLVAAAIGEVVDAETLGGAEMHATVSGLTDFLAQSDAHAITIGRRLLASLRTSTPFFGPPRALALVRPPAYPSSDLLSLAPLDQRTPLDVREIIARLVDGSDFLEFKADYGRTLVACWSTIGGMPIAIIGNNGPLVSAAALKSAQFIHLANQRRTPLLYLHNITGFMVGTEAERGGIIKHGAQLINAVANSAVPAVSVVLGASYGAGNYAMSGRAYKPRFLFAWPTAKVAVMGPDQLASVMKSVGGAKVDEGALRALVERDSDPMKVSSHVIDDGIIDPRETRNVLLFVLRVIYSQPIGGGGRFGVPRL